MCLSACLLALSSFLLYVKCIMEIVSNIFLFGQFFLLCFDLSAAKCIYPLAPPVHFALWFTREWQYHLVSPNLCMSLSLLKWPPALTGKRGQREKLLYWKLDYKSKLKWKDPSDSLGKKEALECFLCKIKPLNILWEQRGAHSLLEQKAASICEQHAFQHAEEHFILFYSELYKARASDNSDCGLDSESIQISGKALIDLNRLLIGDYIICIHR